MESIDGFQEPVAMRFGEIELVVYESESPEDAKPVIVVHELPGMTPSFIEYCQGLVQDGFRVFMPLMFGSPFQEKGTIGSFAFCLRAKFRELYWRSCTGKEPSGFSQWLLSFSKHVSVKHPGSNIGVIGMCLTGGFVLVTFAEPSVNSVVCCQPAFPFFFNKGTLGLTKAELSAAVAGAEKHGDGCAKGFRYRADFIARESHTCAIKNAFGGCFDSNTIDESPAAFPAHSTVTGSDPNEEVKQEIADFLRRRLDDAN